MRLNRKQRLLILIDRTVAGIAADTCIVIAFLLVIVVNIGVIITSVHTRVIIISIIIVCVCIIVGITYIAYTGLLQICIIGWQLVRLQ